VATFERDKLRKAVKRLTPGKDKELQRIVFTFSDNSVELHALNAQRKVAATEKVPCKYSGDTFKISFSAGFLLSILDNIKSERIIMRMVNSIRPVIIQPESQPLLSSMLCLIMPGYEDSQ
jgi:DNA polymerase III sliding clamp (beta) subunit (PCNA family)